MLEPKNIVTPREVAWRVLRRAVGIVYNTALYGLVMFSIGCIIPTPLDREPAKTNYRPTFVTTQVNPTFGSVQAQLTSPLTIALAATDPNTDDTLKVHFFEPDGTPNGFQYIPSLNTTLEIPTPPDSEDPNLRLGHVDASLCLNATAGTKFDLYAVVADREFNTTGPSINLMGADGGLTDTNHWELTCSSM